MEAIGWMVCVSYKSWVNKYLWCNEKKKKTAILFFAV